MLIPKFKQILFLFKLSDFPTTASEPPTKLPFHHTPPPPPVLALCNNLMEKQISSSPSLLLRDSLPIPKATCNSYFCPLCQALESCLTCSVSKLHAIATSVAWWIDSAVLPSSVWSIDHSPRHSRLRLRGIPDQRPRHPTTSHLSLMVANKSCRLRRFGGGRLFYCGIVIGIWNAVIVFVWSMTSFFSDLLLIIFFWDVSLRIEADHSVRPA